MGYHWLVQVKDSEGGERAAVWCVAGEAVMERKDSRGGGTRGGKVLKWSADEVDRALRGVAEGRKGGRKL